MTAILLVRHGEAAAEWGQHEDPGLSELGRQQAGTTAEELGTRIDASWRIASSPRARAVETAAPLLEICGLPLSIDQAYSEVPAPVAMHQRRHWLREFMRQQWSAQPESLWQWRRAIVAGLQGLQHPTVVFTHFLVINAAVAEAEGRDEVLSFWPDNASVTELRLDGGRLKLTSLGRSLQTLVN
ncbi:histidine phosphatase family protein [Parahaliea aestuarii]|uniref:Histidine phosphatase family protein n=1 Tax=Parahaliea aestuarii TaxID=1852021 RepID=A0A5C8ZNN5_9GAMM|nr:histidine phosphatase family protein [Parahaliea aestuarii]TXS90116.1 histidine phosphatase family protein [Parahaliea aestuarii]